jgi:hypothetical protein
MAIKEAITILGTITAIIVAASFIPLMAYVVFPFFNSLSPEKRLEKFINEKCLEGNETAIQIRREGYRYYSEKDYKLVRAAIEGNKHAIRALKLETK